MQQWKRKLKKCFLIYHHWSTKNVPAVKEGVETINFNHYRNTKEKDFIKEEMEQIPLIDKVRLCAECNSAKCYTHDCTSSKNNINSMIMCCFECKDLWRICDRWLCLLKKTKLQGMTWALLNYWVRKVSVYWSDIAEHFTGKKMKDTIIKSLHINREELKDNSKKTK